MIRCRGPSSGTCRCKSFRDPTYTSIALGVICPGCRQDNPSDARFCVGCGARLALACGACGAGLPAGARFCLRCGETVAAGTVAALRSPAPETYTPRYLAEKILTSKAALDEPVGVKVAGDSSTPSLARAR